MFHSTGVLMPTASSSTETSRFTGDCTIDCTGVRDCLCAALLGDRVTVSLGLGVLVAAALAVAFYLWPSSSRYLHEVGTELVKVNWPTWSETKVNTLVVVVTSVIAALILGFFDTTFLWISSSLAKGF